MGCLLLKIHAETDEFQTNELSFSKVNYFQVDVHCVGDFKILSQINRTFENDLGRTIISPSRHHHHDILRYEQKSIPRVLCTQSGYFKNGVVGEWKHQLIRTRDKERAQMLPEKQSKLVDIISHATCSEIITLHFWSSIWNLNVPNLSTFYLNFRGSRWVTSCQSQFAIYCHLWVYHLAYTVVRLIWRTCVHLEEYRTDWNPRWTEYAILIWTRPACWRLLGELSREATVDSAITHPFYGADQVTMPIWCQGYSRNELTPRIRT